HDRPARSHREGVRQVVLSVRLAQGWHNSTSRPASHRGAPTAARVAIGTAPQRFGAPALLPARNRRNRGRTHGTRFPFPPGTADLFLPDARVGRSARTD